MAESLYPVEFENLVQAALSAPEPDPAFMDAMRVQFLNRADLTQKETRMKPNALRFSARLTWGLALLVLLALIVAAFSSPEVVNALRRLLGYIPGVGVVEQTSALRVLAQPVTQTREDVTLTIEQAVTTTDKTVITYLFVRDPNIATSTPPQNTEQPFDDRPSLRLPDGTQMYIMHGSRQAADLPEEQGHAIRYQLTFGPLPQGVDHVVLVLPTLLPLSDFVGPEHWEIPLDFKASSGAQLPVIEVLATATPGAQPTETPSSTVLEPPSFFMDKVVPLPDGYLFMGYTRWIPQGVGPGWTYRLDPDLLTIRDATGQEIPYDYGTPEPIDRPGWSSWAFQVHGKDFHWPLTIEAGALWGDVSVPLTRDAVQLPSFDPGPNPQPGQTWALDEDFQLAGYTTHVSSVHRVELPDSESYYYEFSMDSADGVVGASMLDLDHADQTGSGGGGGGVPDPGPFVSTVRYAGQPPASGPLRAAVFSISVAIRGSWKVAWSPQGGVVGGAPALPAEPAPTATQVLDTYQMPAGSITTSEQGISVALDKVTHYSDGYLFEGSLHWTDPGYTELSGVNLQDMTLVDAAGTEYPRYVDPRPIYPAYTPPQPGVTLWSYQIKSGTIQWPVTLKFKKMFTQLVPGASFTFDAGPDPQLHQTWALDQNVQVGAYSLHIVSARLLSDSDGGRFLYRFTIETSPAADMAVRLMEGDRSMPVGDSQVLAPGRLLSNLYYDAYTYNNKPPSGLIKVTLTEVSAMLPGSWQISWSPPAP